jgi:hypothetical protein
MKNLFNYKRFGAVALSACLTLTACNDDFVSTKPLDQVSEADVWPDEGLTTAFVLDIYSGLGNGGFDEQMLASLTDEAIFTHPGRGITTITESRSQPGDIGWVNNTLAWQNMYQRIRATNIAIENLEAPKFNNPALSTRLLGEAKFLRAYFHHQLLRYYGGIPLVDRAYKLGETDYTIERASFEEGVNFIVSDLDQAAAALKGVAVVKGRASEIAALALKARVLTYAASDLHDQAKATAKSTTLTGFANPELLVYTGGTQINRWEQAKAAAKAVIDYPGIGYAFDLAAPVSPSEGTNNNINIALARSGGDSEILFGRYFINSKRENGGRIGLYNGPNGYHNWAGNTPTQNFVDKFTMADGTPFSWNNPAHAAAPYANRDPRFYGIVLYDGAGWKPRTSDVAGSDPFNQIQTGVYEVGTGGGTVTRHFGLDTRNGGVENWNGTYTGYYLRKFIDDNPAIVAQADWQQIPFPFLRYTEAVLNYIEACIELGQDTEAQNWLNKIRFRAGMPAVVATGAALKDIYRNERLIELSFEEHRYHDTRRWMIPATTIAQKVQYISILGKLKPGKAVPIYRYDPDSYTYEYDPLELDPGKENRAWDDKMYYLPVHRDEMNRNSKLIQNPGYN